MVADGTPLELPETRLRDLASASPPVHIVARIVLVRRREVQRRSDGGKIPLLSGVLSDGSAGVRFTWWDPPREGIDRGTILRAVGAELRTFRGRPELVFTWKTRVAPAGPAELPNVAVEEIPLRPIGELRPQDEGFRLEARVARVGARNVTVGEERRTLVEGLLADRSGAMGFSAWSDFGLKAGETVRIAGAYVREFRRRRSLVLDERSSVERIEGADLPEPAEVLLAGSRPIADLEEAGGGESVSFEGLVVGLLPPSGVVYRCASCRRLVTGGICRVHGQVETVPDLRARLVVDDGTGGATVAAGREATERLWGLTLDEARRRLQLSPDASVLEQELASALVGRRVRVRGAAVADEFGLTVTPESVEVAEVDLESAAAELAARLEGAS